MRGTSLHRIFLLCVVSVTGLVGIGVPSALAAGQNRIASAISNSRSVAIRDSVAPKVRVATDLGPAPAETKLVGMSLRFTPSAAQQAALEQLLVEQQNPASPEYHQWLTPLQYGAQFGLSSADLAKVTAWLASEGFTVTGVANGGNFVTFDGTVAQAQSAFSTSIHSLTLNGESHFANVTDVSVPSALGGVVSAITGLNDFRLKPRVRTSIVKPQFTSSVTGNHFLAPGDLYKIYDMQPLLTGGITGAGIGTASGQCKSVPSGTACGDIAVVGQVQILPTDVAAFRSAAGLSATLPTLFPVGGGALAANNCNPATTTSCPSPNLDDLDESSIDVEWSGAMAPGATVLYVNGPDVFNDSMTQAINKDLAPIITVSYGACEAGWGSSFLNSMTQIFLQANVQGQTILSAAGDDGATDCETSTETSATEGLAVDYPASSPYVTGLGGTQFNEGTATGATQYWLGSDATFAAGSAVPAATYSATGTIPEAAWDDASAGYFGGGGGGISAFFSKPAWQVETGAAGMATLVPADGARDVPDIALSASDAHDPYLYCVQGSCAVGFRATVGGNLTVAGGTSLDSQIFGGMLALVEQKTGSRIGNANPTLYALGNNTAYYNPTGSSVFHDVTTGNNAMVCTQGSVDCPNGGSIGYTAGTGYDLATGWGSVDVNNLATDWNLVTPLGAGTLGSNLSATALTASSNSVASGGTVTFTAIVTGSAGTPTGTVQFLVNNVSVGSGTVSASGVATYQWATSCSTLGDQSISASYSGDTKYQGSVGPALTVSGSSTTTDGAFETSPLIVNVTAGSCPSFTLSGPTSAIPVGSGGTPVATITFTPVNGFTGTVTFNATITDNAGVSPGFTFSPAAVSINSTASVSTTLTLSGIVAGLRLPNAPGKLDSGTLLARQSLGRTVPWSVAGPGATIACLLLLVLPRRRRLGGLLLVALSVALVVGTSGCSSNQAGPPTSNPYAGTYIVTVFGTYSGANSPQSQSTTVTFQVQ